jgi:hypothetical protein
MPHRYLPNTISSVIRTLTTARDAWGQYPAARLITEAQWAQIDPATGDSLLNRLLKEAGDVPLALAAQAPLTDVFNKGLARLTLNVSHFHQVYDLGVARGVFTAGGRAYYGRDVSSNSLPDLRAASDVLEAAAKIGPGEAKRQAAEGAKYVAMALPGAAEVAAIYAEVNTQYKASQQAQAFTDLQQNELAAIYPAAQKLAVSICNTVEFNLGERDDLDDAGRRNIAVLWGVVYIYDDGTPDTPAPVPTLPTAPATPTTPATPNP